MKKSKKRLMKRIGIVAAPIIILSIVSYASITMRSQAYESAFAYEHYYDDKGNSNNEAEYNNTDSDIPEVSNTVADPNGEAAQVITNHDSVVLDTDPKSITVLVNKELPLLPKDFVPEDLVVPNVLFSIKYFDEKKQMRSEAAKALEELFQGATQDNMTLYAISGYRSYLRQYDIFTSNIRKQGLEHTKQYSATPGYSEHQTGLSIDVSAKSANNRLDSSFAETLEGKWLAENAYLYGYIIRYPDGKSDITGYAYEPWHIRYVGKPLATYLYENDLTLEEYYSFEPSGDYSNELNYDNLESFGIALEDVLVPTKVIIPTEVPKEETIDEETAEDPDTTEEDNDTEEDTNNEDQENEDSESEDSESDDSENEDSGNEDVDNGDEDNTDTEDTTPTPTPTKAPKPTKNPTPTMTPVPTQIPASSDIDAGI